MIRFEHIEKSYGNKQVLSGIDLSISRGKIVGLVGENGAGKTTLFRCAAGLETYSGQIKFENSDNQKSLGFLATKPPTLSKITGREYLLFLCKARKIAVPDFDKKNIFDLPLDQYEDSYSTGMLKKLGFLGCLLQKNEVIILDEPFNGVDLQSNELIKTILMQLRAQGKTILISSHILETLTKLCDEIHLLSEGKIIQSVLPEGFNTLGAHFLAKHTAQKMAQLDL